MVHFCSMCGPKFCSMQIYWDIRDQAAAQAKQARKEGMSGMASSFIEHGSAISTTISKLP